MTTMTMINKEGWEIKKLGEVCSIYGRIGFRGYKRTDYVDSIEEGAISLSPSNITDNKLFYDKCTFITRQKYEESPEIKIFNDDILFVKTASVGKCAIVKNLPHEATINPQFVVLKEVKCENKFLFYHLLAPTFQTAVQKITMGSSVPTLSQKALALLSINLPPLPVQHRIVDELDEINAIISAKKQQLQKLDELAQSIFYDMFGDPVANEKGWECSAWNDVLKIVNGKNQKAVETPSGQYPICGSGGVMGYASEFLCPENTTIIGRKGNINKPIYMREKFWNVDTAFGLVADNVHLHPLFLFYFCMEFNFETLNKAVTIPSLTKADLLKINIPLPPLPLQTAFASRVSAIEEQKSSIAASIEKMQTLLDARMQEYFG